MMEKGMMGEEGRGGGNDGRGGGRGPSPFSHPFPLIPPSFPPISTISTSPTHFTPSPTISCYSLSHPLFPLFHSFSSFPSSLSPFSTIPFLSHTHSHPLHTHSTVLVMKSKRPWVRSWVMGMGTLGHGYPGPNPYPYL